MIVYKTAQPVEVKFTMGFNDMGIKTIAEIKSRLKKDKTDDLEKYLNALKILEKFCDDNSEVEHTVILPVYTDSFRELATTSFNVVTGLNNAFAAYINFSFKKMTFLNTVMGLPVEVPDPEEAVAEESGEEMETVEA